jgi:hypothetical protein
VVVEYVFHKVVLYFVTNLPWFRAISFGEAASRCCVGDYRSSADYFRYALFAARAPITSESVEKE